MAAAAQPPYQLGPGLFIEDTDVGDVDIASLTCEDLMDLGTESDDAESVISSEPMDAASSMSSDDELTDKEDEEDVEGEGPARPFAPEDTIFIFDWDDTVLPSTWFVRQGLRLDSASVPTPEQVAELRAMARTAVRTLRVAKRHGHVILITNAERGWIELSCRKFMPWLWPCIEGLKILSARAAYEKAGLVTSPFVWKILAFRSEVGDLCQAVAERAPGRRIHVVSFGDSAHERRALLQATDDLSNCCRKSFKFMEQPDVAQLRRQHDLIYSCFRHIAKHDGNLDLALCLPA
mmetsp:Transcript_11929/g.31535  ORF Transcript_11929/g.31535 Transcript_11929/m.31535 type:complete len:292 (-) Transcript_11929:407-1282(-)